MFYNTEIKTMHDLCKSEKIKAKNRKKERFYKKNRVQRKPRKKSLDVDWVKISLRTKKAKSYQMYRYQIPCKK